MPKCSAYHSSRYDESDLLFKRALEVWESALGSNHPKIAVGRSNLAALYRLQGFFAEAEWYFQRALRIWDKSGAQLTNPRYEPFFANLIEAPRPSWRPWLGPEVGLLHPVSLYDDPLIVDMPDVNEQLSTYVQQVQKLRAPENRKALEQTVEKLGRWYHNLEICPGLTTNPAIGIRKPMAAPRIGRAPRPLRQIRTRYRVQRWIFQSSNEKERRQPRRQHRHHA